MNEQKIKEVFSDEEYVRSLLAMETPEEVQASLAGKGIDFTVDEIKKIGELLTKKANGELTEEELSNVSGGFLITALCVIGVIAQGAAIGAIAVGVVHSATNGRW